LATPQKDETITTHIKGRKNSNTLEEEYSYSNWQQKKQQQSNSVWENNHPVGKQKNKQQNNGNGTKMLRLTQKEMEKYYWKESNCQQQHL